LDRGTALGYRGVQGLPERCSLGSRKALGTLLSCGATKGEGLAVRGSIMRRGQWILMVVVVILCMVGGVYFGSAIGSKENSGVPGGAGLEVLAVGPAGTSPSATANDVPGVDLAKAGALRGMGGGRGATSTRTGPSPLIEWDFGAMAGDLVPDGTGHGYDARIHGQPGQAPIWAGRTALEFDGQGSNDFWRDHSMNCGLGVEKRLDRGFTEMSIEAWVRKAAASGWMPIVYRDKWDDASGFGLYWGYNIGKVVFGHYDTGHKSIVQSEKEIADGQWHHVVGTMQPEQGGDYRYSIYVDGNLDAEQVGTWGVTQAGAEGGILMIAYPNSSGADLAYQGGLGGVAIFDVALSAAQVKARYEAQRAGK
jgi:Concanavalin A-like lectin/glucanases superfamily